MNVELIPRALLEIKLVFGLALTSCVHRLGQNRNGGVWCLVQAAWSTPRLALWPLAWVAELVIFGLKARGIHAAGMAENLTLIWLIPALCLHFSFLQHGGLSRRVQSDDLKQAGTCVG